MTLESSDVKQPRSPNTGRWRVNGMRNTSRLAVIRSLRSDYRLESEALKGKKPTRNANSKIKVNKEAGPISPVLMD